MSLKGLIWAVGIVGFAVVVLGAYRQLGTVVEQHELIRPVSICELYKESDALVFAKVVAWGGATDLTFSGYHSTFLMSPVTFQVLDTLKGTVDVETVGWVRQSINTDGESAEGNLKNASGFVFLRQRDSKWLVTATGFFRETPPSLVKNIAAYSDGLRVQDFRSEVESARLVPTCPDPLDGQPTPPQPGLYPIGPKYVDR